MSPAAVKKGEEVQFAIFFKRQNNNILELASLKSITSLIMELGRKVIKAHT